MSKLNLFMCIIYISNVFGQMSNILTIFPEKTFMLMLEGAELKLVCVAELRGTPNVKVNFLKDGVLLSEGNNNGYHVSVIESVITESNLYKTTITLIKNVADAVDHGRFACQVSGEQLDMRDSIDVITFVASLSDAEMTGDGKESETVELPCDINIKAPPVNVEYTISWERNGTILADSDKYKISNNTLQIFKPTRADLGEYQCVIAFFYTSEVEKQTVRTKPTYLKAGPKIEYHDNDKNKTQGENLELKCKVSGYPIPSVSWFKDGKKIETTKRIHILEYEGAMGKLMIYSLEDEDEGIYKCVAENEVNPYNSTAEMRVRVKENSAVVPSSGPLDRQTSFIPILLITVISIMLLTSYDYTSHV